MPSSAQTAPVNSDEDLVRQFQETGSSDCFAELFVRQRRGVFLACRGFFGDRTAAEDATQETFLRIYQKMSSFQGGNFFAWLLRIARNVCIDQWRKRRPEAEIESDTLSEVAASPGRERSRDLHLMV
jgi:RNA polymerase sigma-70 factor (ECF subfamily)